MQRLIDANALKLSHCKECSLYPDKCMGDDCDWGAIIHINAMPTIEAEPHWIPCSERMPEKDGYYLTTTCYRQVYCDFWNEDHFDRTEAVIAWMPLPKPYEVNHE